VQGALTGPGVDAAMPGDHPVEAVTFDYWNTLVSEDPTVLARRTEAWCRILEAADRPVDAEVVAGAFRTGWDAYVAAWQANRVFGAHDVVPVMVQALGLDLSAVVRGELVDVFLDPPSSRFPPLSANVAPCLAALRDADVRVGIICDVGLTPSSVLRRYLDQQGVLQYFDHWSFSDEVGTYKPDAAIFRHALEGLGGIDPARAAHVGDLRRTDIAGARAVGMTAVRYVGVNDDPVPEGGPTVEGHHVLADHADLLAVLGVT
jgi:putative hydrolase of the HAD superfamily